MFRNAHDVHKYDLAFLKGHTRMRTRPPRCRSRRPVLVAAAAAALAAATVLVLPQSAGAGTGKL